MAEVLEAGGRLQPGPGNHRAIRISQAAGDKRVMPANTVKLLEQLRAINGTESVKDKFYVMGEVATPDPATLGEHFGLLIYELESQAILDWFAGL
jgi:hypothetical protein